MKRFVWLPFVLLVAGCGGRMELRGTDDLTVMPDTALPEPGATDFAMDTRAYRIGPYDKLNIEVFGIPELSREIQIDGNGQLSLPLIGLMTASGKTPTEFAAEVRNALLGRYVRDPQVSVNLLETVSQVVTISGQVQAPGLYPVVGKMTLIRAIATAKGTAEYARKDSVVVFRTVAGKRYAALYNLGAIERGIYADPEIFANDVVIVGDNPARRLFKDILQAAPLLTTPLVIALQRRN